MTFFEKINQLIKDKNLTFREVERDCGFANASIRRWETQSPRFESVIKIANYLQVSVEYLAYDNSEKTNSCDNIPLSQNETDLIAMYRLLDNQNQETIFDFTTMLYEKKIGEKDSIYSTYTEEEKSHKKSDHEETNQSSDIA